MQNFRIYTPDNPMPKPVRKSTAWLGNKVAFIKATVNSSSFYIAAADDEPELVMVKFAWYTANAPP